ncbi:proton-conducting transporter membrane subunit [Streptosporangium lutulentum]
MSASIAYLVFYAAMNIGAFAVVMLVSRRSARNELDDYRGLVFQNPVAGLALAFFLACLAGLPPGLAGLFAKIVVFREIVGGGGGWLAAVMAVNTVIGLYYYVTWIVRIFTPAPVPASGADMTAGAGGRRTGWVPVSVAIALAGIIAVAFSIAPQTVLDLLPTAFIAPG